MRNTIITITFIILSLSCGEGEIVTIENIKFFNSEHFKRFNRYTLSSLDFELAEDGSIIIVGNGGENSSHTKAPFLLNLNPNYDLIIEFK